MGCWRTRSARPSSNRRACRLGCAAALRRRLPGSASTSRYRSAEPPMDDHERPPVLAHQRFVAERAAFDGLDLRARFERIHATNLWGAATSVSGLGSELPATAALAAALPALLRELKVASLLDAPCGDAAWIHRIGLDVDYTGVDIVPAIVEPLQRRATAGELRGRYLLADITRDPLPRADAVLCRDCLVHLSFAHIAQTIDNLDRKCVG